MLEQTFAQCCGHEGSPLPVDGFLPRQLELPCWQSAGGGTLCKMPLPWQWLQVPLEDQEMVPLLHLQHWFWLEADERLREEDAASCSSSATSCSTCTTSPSWASTSKSGSMSEPAACASCAWPSAGAACASCAWRPALPSPSTFCARSCSALRPQPSAPGPPAAGHSASAARAAGSAPRSSGSPAAAARAARTASRRNDCMATSAALQGLQECRQRVCSS
mmetsp:Transcript_44187/g.136568  ORF Transcript_44187/g.136568 Transcript_44187/m.136568 type:complete len:220 (-) Transcript_44187:45-704(-)